MSRFKEMKIRVENKEHSLQIQDELFRLGYEWASGDKEYDTAGVYLFTDQEGYIRHSVALDKNYFWHYPAQEYTLEGFRRTMPPKQCEDPATEEELEAFSKVCRLITEDKIQHWDEASEDWVRAVGEDLVENFAYTVVSVRPQKEMKPCPFCGGEPVIRQNEEKGKEDEKILICECGLVYASFLPQDENEIVEKWNERSE